MGCVLAGRGYSENHNFLPLAISYGTVKSPVEEQSADCSLKKKKKELRQVKSQRHFLNQKL